MTLLDVLLGAVREAPGQVIVHVRGDGSELTVALRELLDDALHVAGGLREAGVVPGTCVPLLADRSEDFQPMFWGALAAGLVPVPLAPDARRVLPVWEHLGRPPVVVDAATREPAGELAGDVRVLTLDVLRHGPMLREPVVAGPDDVAFVQFSSGSTGAPKGVEVTHGAVLANLEQIRQASALGADDVVVSWMPYFHDMGLIGTHLAPLAARAKQVKIGPLSFAKRPRIWFEVADRHRATVLSAANFALALAVRRVPDEVVARLDLSTVRLMLVGAEPIAPVVWREFARTMRPAGLDPAAAQPVYGLAEATLAVTFPPPGEVAEPLVLDRAALSRGEAVDAVVGEGAVELMDVGPPVAGCAVRIVDDEGAELGDRRVGHIMVSGPQLARGYHGLPGVSADVFAGGWLRTGDLGFLRDGRLCVTGRHKDVLFLNGRTFHAPDMEAVAAATPGLPTGAPAVIGSTDPVTGGERVVVFVPWARPPGEAAEVLERVAARVREALLHDDVRVLALPPGAFPRTTSGKLQRQRLRERFEAGDRGPGEAVVSSAGAGAGPGSVAPVAPVLPVLPLAPVPAAAPRSRSRTEAEQAVREVWARVLGRAAGSIGLHEPFGSLGGTSLKAMEVLVALEDAFGLTLPPAVIRDHGTVAALAGHLLASSVPVRPASGPESARLPAATDGSAAVIGMACRFPGADTPDAFWDLLIDGHDAVTPVPDGRWDDGSGARPAADRKRWGALLDDPAAFDAGYFGIGEDEARALDPQARLFLELAHEALERAGYAGPRRRGRRIGVFAAVGESGYREVLDRASADGSPLPATLTGNLPSLIAARVSQCLDLDGPALAVDTACSSGLVALHLARRSLLDGECDLAVVGGVNLHLTSTGHRLLEEAQALSPTGRSRAFSADADGFVPGEGGAAVVLTRLDAARTADDSVLAVVRGTAVNNDGRSMSLMAPNPLRQREVISRAYEAAGVDPASVTYVEAHGTGTAVGDPIELRSLAHAFPVRADGEPRLLGSVKTNIGHLLNAAALPALVKVVLALHHRRLPPSLHHAPASPGLAPAGFSVVAEARDWTASGPLVAGVNAFGFGGTNAHAVLEEAPLRAPYEGASAGPHLLTLSARSTDGLREAADRLAAHLGEHPELDEGDVCLTASTARDDGPYRLAVVADGDLRARLARSVPGMESIARSRPRLVFLFPGQGAQSPGRDRALYRTAPVFRDTLDEASALLGPVCGRPLVDWGLDPDAGADAQARTEVAQPLLVASGVALARQLREWGVEPDAVAGHSVGEIAAACVGGVLTLRDAVRFAAERGRLMGAFTEPGAMIAVRGGEEAVAAVVAGADGDLAVAAYNGPGLQVLSGSVSAVERAARDLGAQGVAVRRLRVSRAFHSPLMRPVAERLADAARALTLHEPSIPLMSTVTAEWQPVLDPDHLREHALRPVLFGAAVERLAGEGYDTFVEVGHGATLSGAARAAAGRGGAVLVVPALPGGADGSTPGGAGRGALLETIGRLWSRGVPLDRTALDADRHRVPLPAYPFRRDRYWADPPVSPLLHRVLWEEADLPEAPAAAVRSVLLTGPDTASVSRLAGQLSAEGIRLHTGGEAPPDAVVLVAGPAPAQEDADALGRAQEAALAAFGEALALLDGARANRMVVLTEDVHTTGAASERPRPAHAVLGGPLLALPQETPGCSATGVDLCSLDTPAQRLAAVLAELRAGSTPGGATVAWRAGRRLTRGVSPLAPTRAAAVPLPPDGTFLITGGGGGIGGALARDLAGRGRPTLVLAGRSPQPPAGLVEELRALGATVHHHVADVSVERDVDLLIARLPRLDGLFHAAGVVRPGTLRSRNAQDSADALAAKTRGTLLLSLALRRHGLAPAVCVTFSSVSALLPGLAGALGDYAGANAFLDAFAASERRAGRPWLSVNLAAFAETGMAAGLGAGAGPGSAAAQRAGGRPVATAPALAALRTAWGVDAAQLVLADLAPSGRGAEASAAVASLSVPGAAPGPVPGAQPLSLLSPLSLPMAADAVTRTAPGTAALLRRLLAAALRLPPAEIPDDAPFLTLGLDSLAAVDLVRQLERELGASLPATLFFEYRTVRELAAHLDAPADQPPPPPADPSPVADGVPFPLTPVQLALHTSGRLHPDIPAHGYVRQTVQGPLDIELLGRALTLLADRHTMLRVRVEDRPDENGTTAPRQYIAPPTALSAWYEVREHPGRVEDLESALRNRPFDLSAEPPVRAVLARESPDLAHLVLVIHHVAGDGYSLNVLAEELWSLYTALTDAEEPGAESSLPALSTDFARYSAAAAEERSSAHGAQALADGLRHWSGRLATRGEPLRLPYDGDPDALPTAPLASRQSALDAPLTAALEERAAAHGVSLFHLLLAAHVRCLGRWSGQREVSVNVARARRDVRLPGLDRLVGPLADTLPLLCETGPDESVWDLAERIGQLWLEGERHAAPTSLDLARLLPERPAGAGPRTVSPAGFSFARFPAALDARCPVTVRPTAAGTGTPATRLSLLCWQDGTVLRFSWNFPVHLFAPETVARLDRDFRGELSAVAEGELSALAGAETARPETSSATIVERLLARFRATPDAVAVDTGAETLTYAELDHASHALAARLTARGVTPGSLVGLLTEPGADAVVSVVAVLRAGAGWVPLDSGHPTARLADQLDRSGARTVLCHAATRAAGQALGDGVALVSADMAEPAPQGPADEPVGPVDADSIAYVIFTSGSTGRPKAVPITYRSMENYLSWAIGTFGYDEHDRLAQTASLCFDASVRQLLAPLLVGATVVTVDRDLLRDPALLLTHVERTRITVWSSVPTLWEQLLAASEERVRRGAPRPDLSSLRWIHVGGEALSPAHVRRWFDLFGGGQRIANLYGPTEATINTTCHIINARPDDHVRQLPIGRPVAGTQVEVVGPDGELREPGEAGELLIAGIGLTPGYLGEPALTEAAFTNRRGRRWYRSGDRARVAGDGTLEFLGRLDDQVKVRGNRVEPGEIEAVLRARPDIAQAVVLLQDGRLVAFVTPTPGASGADAVALRLHLAETLPPYMLPSRITSVDRMPLTGTGKIDRRGLLALRAGAPAEAGDEPVEPGDASRTAPLTPTEVRLARIWSVLLQADGVCREDDFFALGGDSLLVLEVFARLEKEGGPLPRPTVIYRHRTLAALAGAVDAAATDPADPPVTAVDPSLRDAGAGGAGPLPFPLTPTQRGFLLAEAIAPGEASSWLTRLRLHGPLDTARFQLAVDALVVRHPMLRTVFPAGARPAVQQELPPSLRLPVDFETVTGPHGIDDAAAAERRRRFEPWAWPLLRLRVLTLAPDEHVLLVHAHHIIGDGYSSALLIRELTTVYDALSRGEEPALAPLRSTFRDHAARLAVRADATDTTATTATTGADAVSPEATHEGSRWALLSAPYRPPALSAGTGGSSGAADRHTPFLTHGFTLGADRVEGLRGLASRTGATLYAPVLTAYYRALVATTGREDLVLGLAVSGRDLALPDAHRVFGPYATAVPLRPAGPDSGRPSGADFEDDLRRIVADATSAQVHEGPVPPLPGGLPLASQFFFTYLDFSALGPESGRTLTVGRQDSAGEYTPPPVGTDVFLAAGLDSGRLRLTLRASASAFTPQALAAFAEAVRDALTHAAAAPVPVPVPVTVPLPVPKQRRAGSRTVASPSPGGPGQEPRMDAALIGYLPPPAHLARLARLPEAALPREELRTLLFPDGRPRLLETLSTPLGRSGFVCVPLFADELAPGSALLGHTAHGVELASSFGARSVSLAGMIPSLTGYGFDVLRALGTTGAATAVTTGHAATVVSVVKTVHAALAATGQELGSLTVAFVGLGSIGSSSLELLLGQAESPPARLLLCDVAGSGPRLKELAERLRERGLADAVDVLPSDGGLPDAVYGARLIVAAVSGGGTLLDVDRLEPGTTVVDDSFPHCFDTGRAIGRMGRAKDVLVVGGGLLSIGAVERQVADGLPAAAVAGYLAQPSLPGTIASCRLESLLHASGADVPLVRGPVGTATGLAYWAAAEAGGTDAAPLHLLTHTIDAEVARRIRQSAFPV
ncbi:non-ribosomal peptide synthetase/type I polyketide synthase [Streptomyces cyaneofuscatus]|uniref:non-ribosomal peptide synthetase/type I polyketide synthase n=1 Tax=Streptomyces cyaneofuscatus TaxID=66883 RepID=UPI00342D02DA